jgi:hypothetical protein
MKLWEKQKMSAHDENGYTIDSQIELAKLLIVDRDGKKYEINIPHPMGLEIVGDTANYFEHGHFGCLITEYELKIPCKCIGYENVFEFNDITDKYIDKSAQEIIDDLWQQIMNG